MTQTERQHGKARVVGMRLAFVENAGPDNVGAVLKGELQDAREVCIAVAFVTSGARTLDLICLG